MVLPHCAYYNLNDVFSLIETCNSVILGIRNMSERCHRRLPLLLCLRHRALLRFPVAPRKCALTPQCEETDGFCAWHCVRLKAVMLTISAFRPSRGRTFCSFLHSLGLFFFSALYMLICMLVKLHMHKITSEERCRCTDPQTLVAFQSLCLNLCSTRNFLTQICTTWQKSCFLSKF